VIKIAGALNAGMGVLLADKSNPHQDQSLYRKKMREKK